MLLVLELPHAGVALLPHVAGAVGEGREEAAGVGVEHVAVADVGAHHVEQVAEDAQLQLRLRVVAVDDGPDAAPSRHLRV